jgi:uncharacterized protein
LKSCLYLGSLRHRRFTPKPHAFRYPLFMVYLDLAELDEVFRRHWWWSMRRWAPARFCRADHLGDAAVPLDQAVRGLVARETGRRPQGPIRLLTHLRYFGHCFNPVSFYYCFDAGGENVECVVAEVNNTPWGERHCYVLTKPDQPVEAATGMRQGYRRYHSGKVFHVSPFMPMELDYAWGFSVPSDKLLVHMALHEARREGAQRASTGVEKVFDATLRLERAPVTGMQLARTLVRFPLMTVQVMAAIHWQALKLWVKRVPVHTHPAKLNAKRSNKGAPLAKHL